MQNPNQENILLPIFDIDDEEHIKSRYIEEYITDSATKFIIDNTNLEALKFALEKRQNQPL